MKFFDRLFGRKPVPETLAPEAPRTASTPRRARARPVTLAEGGVRPFDAIAEALQAWQVDDALLAEKLFEQGIDAYKRLEPGGVDFALGRYGAFLVDQDRKDDAARILEQAIELKTDIPAIWSDYLRLVADRHDVESFKRSIERMAASVTYRVEADVMLTHARRALREGAADFAEAVVRWVIERATGEGDKEGRWAAIGDLGRILEHGGRVDGAVGLWRDAFN
jgi:hypothetical protein